MHHQVNEEELLYIIVDSKRFDIAQDKYLAFKSVVS